MRCRQDGAVPLSEKSVLGRVAAALLSRPFVYNLVQVVAGRDRVIKRLREAAGSLPSGRVLDVGSASGQIGLGLGIRPICLDIDFLPLSDRRRRGTLDLAVQGDAARLPFVRKSFDLTLCTAVSHHLDDDTLLPALAEIGRVTSGTFLFFDATRNDSRWLSRSLWRFDRGRHPRTEGQLLGTLERLFHPRTVAGFAVFHQYLLFIGTPRDSRTVESSRGDSEEKGVS